MFCEVFYFLNRFIFGISRQQTYRGLAIYAGFAGERKDLANRAQPQGFQGQFKAEGNLEFKGELGAKLKALKARTRCKDCNKFGHWAGDEECTSPSPATKRLREKRLELQKARTKGSTPKPKSGAGSRAGGFMERAGLGVSMVAGLVLGL